MNGFEAPAFFDEGLGQRVEEFGKRGLFSSAVEIVWIAGDELVEMP